MTIQRRAVSDLTTQEVARFWSKVQKDAPNSCWLWAKCTNNTGYGRFETWHQGRRQRFLAHRVAYQLAIGEPPADRFLLHSCDTPRCCNPAHLRPGTQAENLAEMRAKGRASQPPHPCGEDHPGARLTAAEVAAIRQRYAEGGVTQRALGAEYGVTKSTISSIIRSKVWGDLPGVDRRTILRPRRIRLIGDPDEAEVETAVAS